MIRSLSVNGQTFQVSYKYFRFDRIHLLSQTRIAYPISRINLVNVPLATGTIGEERVIVGVMGPVEFEDLWSFEVDLDDSDFVQRQMKLPLCVICDESSVVYIKQRDTNSDAEICSRIRYNDFL